MNIIIQSIENKILEHLENRQKGKIYFRAILVLWAMLNLYEKVYQY